jgi:hypothetical protein
MANFPIVVCPLNADTKAPSVTLQRTFTLRQASFVGAEYDSKVAPLAATFETRDSLLQALETP